MAGVRHLCNLVEHRGVVLVPLLLGLLHVADLEHLRSTAQDGGGSQGPGCVATGCLGMSHRGAQPPGRGRTQQRCGGESMGRRARANCAGEPPVLRTSRQMSASFTVPNAFFMSAFFANSPLATLVNTRLDCKTSSTSFSLHRGECGVLSARVHDRAHVHARCGTGAPCGRARSAHTPSRHSCTLFG